MYYINQLDYPDIKYLTRTSLEGEEGEKGKHTTVESSGCGLCASIMVAHRLLPNCTFSIEDALQLSYEAEANYNVGTCYKRYAPAFKEKLGLILEDTDDSERLLYCLRTGGAAVAHVGGDQKNYIGVFSHGGHYIAVIGQEPDGRVAILDPSYKEGKYEEEGRKGKVEMKNGVIALCDVEVLKKDCASRKPAFHLFWRK